LHLTVIKRIPSEAGLGGASSDAAGLLRAVPLLTRSRASEFELSEIARAVGADVPFYLSWGGRRRPKGTESD
ncbi:MAG: 4-diphosphocytidyl-2-C-methyl-D-erythritol kinase, partial [Armatimonadetes bacterium OLB18]